MHDFDIHTNIDFTYRMLTVELLISKRLTFCGFAIKRLSGESYEGLSLVKVNSIMDLRRQSGKSVKQFFLYFFLQENL